MKNALLCLALPILITSCADPKIVDPVDAPGPFSADSGTVLLADFNNDSVNSVTRTYGTVEAGRFVPALFGSGVRMQEGATVKYGVDFPNSEAFALRSEIEGSLEALVWTDSAQPGWGHILEKAWQYGLSVHNGKLSASFGTAWWEPQIVLPLGKWSYVAATYDGTTVRLYLDGELAASSPFTGERGPGYSTQYDLSVGNSSSAVYDVPFKGIIDAVRVSRTVRTGAEIAAVWAGIPAPTR